MIIVLVLVIILLVALVVKNRREKRDIWYRPTVKRSEPGVKYTGGHLKQTDADFQKTVRVRDSQPIIFVDAKVQRQTVRQKRSSEAYVTDFLFISLTTTYHASRFNDDADFQNADEAFV